MIPALYDERQLYYYDGNGNKIQGMNPLMKGNPDAIYGDCTYVQGDISKLSGDITGLKIENAANYTGPLINITVGLTDQAHGAINNVMGDTTRLTDNITFLIGDFTGIYGSAYGITGDIELCELTQQDRDNGIDIKDLIAPTGTSLKKGLRSIKEQLEEVDYIRKKIDLLTQQIPQKQGHALLIANVLAEKQLRLYSLRINKIMDSFRVV